MRFGVFVIHRRSKVVGVPIERVNSQMEDLVRDLCNHERNGTLAVPIPVSEMPNDEAYAFIGLFQDLIEQGFIPKELFEITKEGDVVIRGISSKARTYFDEIARQEQESIDRLRATQRFNWSIALGTLAASAALNQIIDYLKNR